LPHAAPIVELVHGPLVESEKDGVVAEPVVDVPGVRVGNKKNPPKKPPKNPPKKTIKNGFFFFFFFKF
jgi:hypothetical protein